MGYGVVLVFLLGMFLFFLYWISGEIANYIINNRMNYDIPLDWEKRFEYDTQREELQMRIFQWIMGIGFTLFIIFICVWAFNP